MRLTDEISRAVVISPESVPLIKSPFGTAVTLLNHLEGARDLQIRALGVQSTREYYLVLGPLGQSF